MTHPTCKTCRYWKAPDSNSNPNEQDICGPLDPDTYKPTARGFETRICRHPSQAYFEAPVRADCFALTDASQFFASLATGENFGCVLHEVAKDGH